MSQTSELRLLLADDSAETREYLSKLLQFEPQIELVGLAGNGKQAVELARETKPDLILMDINMPVMDGITATEIIFKEMPSVRVVMMSVQSEMAYLRRAMQVGAREFLIKPFTHEQLMNILGQVSTLEATPSEAAPGASMPGGRAAAMQPVKTGTLVTVFSPRGGAGCSTVALNLAIVLQGQRKAGVLLMDGNLRFGALDVMLNLQISRSIIDLLPSLDDSEPELLHAATLPHTSGIRLLAAPPSPEMADMVSVQQLQRIIALARRRYEYVVADLGSCLDDRALGFMDVADQIVVLITPDIPAIKNARLFLEVTRDLEYDMDDVLLVLNRADPRGGITAEAVERHIKHPVVLSLPDVPRVAMAAINRGVPLVFYEREVQKDMPLTRKLLSLADKVPEPGMVLPQEAADDQEAQPLERLPDKAPATEPQKKGLLGGLFKWGR